MRNKPSVAVDILLAPEAAVETPAISQDVFLTNLYEQMDEHLDDSAFGVL